MRKKIKHLMTVLFAAALVISPKFVYADSFQDGIKAYQARNYNYAMYYFENAYSQHPDNDSIKYYLAITYVHNNKFAEAKALYKDILRTSSSQEVISLARTGLKLLGETNYGSNSSNSASSSFSVNKAILNVDTVGDIIIVNDVMLNDSSKVKFIFDTGASYTTISSEIASRLGISTDNADKIKIMTGSGYIDAPKVTIKKISVNGLTAYNVPALVADLPIHNTGMAGDIAGLLGLSYLNNYKFTVDKKNNRITLEK